MLIYFNFRLFSERKIKATAEDSSLRDAQKKSL